MIRVLLLSRVSVLRVSYDPLPSNKQRDAAPNDDSHNVIMLTVIITLDSVTCIVNDHGLKTAASYGLFSAEGFSDLDTSISIIQRWSGCSVNLNNRCTVCTAIKNVHVNVVNFSPIASRLVTS